MPLLILLGLGIPTVISTAALAWHSVTSDTTETVERATPNLALLAGLGIAGLAVWYLVKK